MQKSASAEDLIRQGSKSFSLASVFLPAQTKPDVLLLYAFCRTCDDQIDESGADSGFAALLKLQELTFDSPSGPQSWIFEGIQALLRSRTLRPEYIEELFEGFRMDLEHRGYPCLADLELYCFRVAGVVGLMMCPLIGVVNPLARDAAVDLGIAMQLTNICRDIQADAKIGRVYVPLELLGGGTVQDWSKKLSVRPELAHESALRLLARADELYSSGNRGLADLPFRSALAIACASALYRRIGLHLLKNHKRMGAGAYRQRTVVPRAQKIPAVVEGILRAIGSRFKRNHPGSRTVSAGDWELWRYPGPRPSPSARPAQTDSASKARARDPQAFAPPLKS
ncbi:MAG: phytoene/squalene synthase family protein [Proteobacteria bacterium]|nr:phytoene/squalene synthase family protein [Pseudomonadota bacterium]